MRRSLFPLVTFSLVAALASTLAAALVPAAQAQENSADTAAIRAEVQSAADKYVPGEVLVRFRPGVTKPFIGYAHAAVNARVVKTYRTLEDLQLVRLPEGVSVDEAIKIYQENPDVLYAEPNYIQRALVNPNDPSFGSLWGLHNTGQSGGTVDADIDAPEAWNLTTGSSNVVVVVIDTGINYSHPDLAANMIQNEVSCADGVDNDGNGYIDDCYGIDTANNDTNPADGNGHGTHLSGTIGAVGNNNVGVVGVNWIVKLMACKFLSDTGSGTSADAIDCLNYVNLMKDRGVNIVATNDSWGGGAFSQALSDAIDSNMDRGILFVAAAGNGGSDGIGDDNDVIPHYPSSYYLPNIIAVAATTRTDARSSFSNFGRRSVHLGAPGSEILSTWPTTVSPFNYHTISGTSMATPHVAGAVALLKAFNPTLDWKGLKNLILASGNTIASMSQTATGKRLNIHGAMTCSGATLLSRLRPLSSSVAGTVGTPILLSALHISCSLPNGNVNVTVNPGGQTLTLLDDGAGNDQVAGDGIYSGQFTPANTTPTTLTFPNGDIVSVVFPVPYVYTSVPFSNRSFTGTRINMTDESSLRLFNLPFPLKFGAGGNYTEIYMSSNGVFNFNSHWLNNFVNQSLPYASRTTVGPLFWDDLYPVPNTDQEFFFAILGTEPNRELVLEFRDVRAYDCRGTSSATVKFQVVFFEGLSRILYNYSDVIFGGGCESHDRGGSATVGMQVSPATSTQFSFNSQSLNDSNALLWQLPTEPDGTFSGKVQDANNAGVSGATVEARQGGVSKFSTTTDSSGNYSLNVFHGTYDLVAYQAGYVEATKPGMGINLDQTINNVNFKLFRQSFFQGTVTNKVSGYPLGGALVEAVQGSTVVGSGTSAADGSYSVPVIQGSYKVRASLSGYKTKTTRDKAIGDGVTKNVNVKLKPL